MKAKLIKTDVNYLLRDEEDVIIASTSFKTAGISLSKQNCDEIFGVTDVEKLDRKIRGLMMISGTSNGTIDHPNTDKMISLFNKSMQLNKDKVFTLEDIKKSINWAWRKTDREEHILIIDEHNFIQSLQQPTEIEVTFDPEEKDSEGCLILKKI